MEKAKLAQIKVYFGYNRASEFKKDWDALNLTEQEFFRTEVGKIVNA